MRKLKKGYDGFDGVELVVNRGSRAGQVVDLVNFEKDGFNDVVANEFEVGVSHVMQHVLFPSREEVVHHDHAVPSFHQTVHQVASHETGTTGHQHPLLLLHSQRHRQWDPLLPSFHLFGLPGRHRAGFLHEDPPSRESQLERRGVIMVVSLRSRGLRREEVEEESGDGDADEEERGSL